VDRNRIKTYAHGLDESLAGGLPQGYVVLVSGGPGTMKSSFAFSVVYQNALREGRKSAYFTLEQSKEGLLEQMGSMGMADEPVRDHIALFDMGALRRNLTYLQGRGTWLELFKMHCSNAMKADAVSILVVDSLDVLETMSKMEDRRSDLYFLFEWLRDLGPLTLVLSEKPLAHGPDSIQPDEAYLADGIVQLEMVPTSDLRVERRLRIVKMRAANHATGYQMLSYREGGFTVAAASPMAPEEAHKPTPTR
jgi:KaiC/GvpD/RAD55 family RecA-like ATPase